MNGREMIDYERARQISDENWSVEHDEEHCHGELMDAAIHYLVHGLDGRRPQLPPWPLEPDWWKPQTPLRDLVRAGALALAEADRLDRRMMHHALMWEEGIANAEVVAAVKARTLVEGIAVLIDRMEAE